MHYRVAWMGKGDSYNTDNRIRKDPFKEYNFEQKLSK